MKLVNDGSVVIYTSGIWLFMQFISIMQYSTSNCIWFMSWAIRSQMDSQMVSPTSE